VDGTVKLLGTVTPSNLTQQAVQNATAQLLNVSTGAVNVTDVSKLTGSRRLLAQGGVSVSFTVALDTQQAAGAAKQRVDNAMAVSSMQFINLLFAALPTLQGLITSSGGVTSGIVSHLLSPPPPPPTPRPASPPPPPPLPLSQPPPQGGPAFVASKGDCSPWASLKCTMFIAPVAGGGGHRRVHLRRGHHGR
jgi:hypothetical protein